MTAREVVDEAYRQCDRGRVPMFGNLARILQSAGFEIRETVRAAWERRNSKVKGSDQYSRLRDWVRAFRTIDRWLADQIDATKQEVPA